MMENFAVGDEGKHTTIFRPECHRFEFAHSRPNSPLGSRLVVAGSVFWDDVHFSLIIEEIER